MWITGILCASAVKNQPSKISRQKSAARNLLSEISEKSKNGKISKKYSKCLAQSR